MPSEPPVFATTTANIVCANAPTACRRATRCKPSSSRQVESDAAPNHILRKITHGDELLVGGAPEKIRFGLEVERHGENDLEKDRAVPAVGHDVVGQVVANATQLTRFQTEAGATKQSHRELTV